MVVGDGGAASSGGGGWLSCRCRDGGDDGSGRAGAGKKRVGEGRRRKKKVEEIRWRERMGESETTFSDLMLRNLSE